MKYCWSKTNTQQPTSKAAWAPLSSANARLQFVHGWVPQDWFTASVTGAYAKVKHLQLGSLLQQLNSETRAQKWRQEHKSRDKSTKAEIRAQKQSQEHKSGDKSTKAETRAQKQRQEHKSVTFTILLILPRCGTTIKFYWSEITSLQFH